MARLNALWLLMAAVMLGAGQAPATARAAPPTSPELFDYLIQDVCVDARDTIVPGDPATCVRHRNIALGEASPYILTDINKANGATYSAMNSIPVKAVDGATEILVAKSLAGHFTPDFRFSFDPVRDGYDLIDTVHSPFASFIRTSDPSCIDQIFSRSTDRSTMAARAGGWVLFPRTAPGGWPAIGTMPVTTYDIHLTPGRKGCEDGHSAGQTFWNRPAAYRFETGKMLTAIRSDHFASALLGSPNNALERTYFTKAYGFTRWEAWIPLARCVTLHGDGDATCHPERADYPLAGRCSVMTGSGTPFPGLAMWGGQKWVRVDCRDQTNYIALKTPQRMIDPRMARANGVNDITP